MTPEYEVWWSGQLEHDGLAPGLSRCTGNSTLFYSPPWPEDANRNTGGRPIGITNGARDAEILRLLKTGCSYWYICKQIGCSFSVPRRVAKRNGIDRSMFAHRAGVSAPGHRA